MPLSADPKNPARKKNPHQNQGMDDLCKTAMERDGGRLLHLVFTPEVCQKLDLPVAPPRLLEVLPTELRRKRQYADYLIKVDIGGMLALLHIEFQNKADPRMPLRIVQYQVAVLERHSLPVYSVVFNVASAGEQAVCVQAAIELCEQRFGQKPDGPGLERIRQIREPGLLTRLIVRLGTASSLGDALSVLPAT